MNISVITLSILYLTLNSFCVFSQLTYRWTGSVNSSFSVAGNWEPFRQVGRIDDILIFDTGSNLIIENVNQVTVGQIKIVNNTYVTLSPSSGNSKTISVHGGDGDDLLIEEGSSLRIYGNDPRLNIYLKTGARASVYGTIIIDGNLDHNINAADQESFRFKENSLLIQNSPGHIFGTSGIQNSVVFESGSTYKINNPQASSPFGLTSPQSKVIFQEGSTFVINTHYNLLSLSGRNYPDIVIESGINVNVNENIVNNFSARNITVKNNSLFRINNTSNSKPSFNLIGNLTVNGEFSFQNIPSNKLQFRFAGTKPQSVYGNGTILFPANLGYVFIENSIILNRNLLFDCSVNHVSGTINTNGFTLTINGQFITPEGSRNMKGVVINLPSGNPEPFVLSVTTKKTAPKSFSLGQNYPNPSNPKSKIDFALPFDAKVTVKLYDMLGREVATMMDAQLTADYYTLEFDGSNLASGTYFYRIIADNGKEKLTKTMKMILVK